VVPEQAVIETPSGPVVYIVDREGKVAIQNVQAADTFEGLRAITHGLEPGVPVIVEGLQLVRPGLRVKTERAVLPRPIRDESKGAAPQANPRPAETAGEPPKKPAPRNEKPVVEPGGPRSAVKAEEESRPAPAPGAAPKS
jgi:hypothetical protein